MSDMSGRMEKSENRESSVSEMTSKPDWKGSHYDRVLNLFLTGYQSDLILHLGSEGLKIPVHRIFLLTGSPVLNEMLKKTGADLIIKDDVDIRIFRMLLKYLYTGETDVEMADALHLMQLANKYQVQDLRDHCATVLEGDLTLENVLSLFECGMEYAHGDFIQSTLKFICKNARKILKSDHFTTLRLDCLIEVIQQDSLQVGNEIEVFEAVYRICTTQKVLLKSIYVWRTNFEMFGRPQNQIYYWDRLHVKVTTARKNINPTIYDDDQDSSDLLRIYLPEAIEIDVEDKVTISFSGEIGRKRNNEASREYEPCENYNVKVANYGEFVTLSEVEVGIKISRGEGNDLLALCYGLIEKLELFSVKLFSVSNFA